MRHFINSYLDLPGVLLYFRFPFSKLNDGTWAPSSRCRVQYHEQHDSVNDFEHISAFICNRAFDYSTSVG